MKIAEVKSQRKVWDIEIYTNKFGHKFIKAKCMTEHDTLLEIQLYRMPDGVVIAYEVNNNLVDNETISELRKAMIELRKQYCTTERNRW